MDRPPSRPNDALTVGAADIAGGRNFEAIGTFRKSARSTSSVSKIRTQTAQISKIRTPEKERQTRRSAKSGKQDCPDASLDRRKQRRSSTASTRVRWLGGRRSDHDQLGPASPGPVTPAPGVGHRGLMGNANGPLRTFRQGAARQKLRASSIVGSSLIDRWRDLPWERRPASHHDREPKVPMSLTVADRLAFECRIWMQLSLIIPFSE